MPCTKKCTTKGENGHLCEKTCSKECGKCMVAVKKIIPQCGHVQKVACSIDPEKFKCTMPCPKRCTTNGENGHMCRKTCSEECGKCMVAVKKVIPRCGHVQVVPCYQDPGTFVCQKPCKRKPYSCDHTCQDLCGEDCDSICFTMVIREREKCGHKYHVPCWYPHWSKPSKCEHPVEYTLPCGHVIQKECSECNYGYICEKGCGTFYIG